MDYPSWQRPLQEAWSESDVKIVEEKVFETEAAIFERSQELAASSNGDQEREAMKRGLAELLKIKTEKLKWPPRLSLSWLIVNNENGLQGQAARRGDDSSRNFESDVA